MIEEWRAVSGYEGLYEVSSFGRVRSLDRVVKAGRGGKGETLKEGRILSPILSHKGYLRVCLVDGQSKKARQIHRIVAEAFLPKRDGASDVNHIDLDKANNAVENLEWVTPSENMRHARSAGAYSAGRDLAHVNPRKCQKLSNDDISEIRSLIIAGEIQRDIAAKFGVAESMISMIKTGKTRKSPEERAQ